MQKLLKIKENIINKNPEVAIVCCARNASRFIEDSLNSILLQQFLDFHLLILDDCSLDNTVVLAEKILENSNISFSIYKSFENIGVPKGRNFLINNSKSKYIAIQDADDVSMPYRLSAQVDFLNKNSSIDVIGAKAIKIDDHGKFIGLMSYPPLYHDEINSMFTGKVNPMIDPTTCFKRSSFTSLGGYSENESIRLAQDFDFWIRLSKNGGKIANIDATLLAYRISSQGLTSSKKEEMIKAHVAVQSIHYKFLESVRRLNAK